MEFVLCFSTSATVFAVEHVDNRQIRAERIANDIEELQIS